MRNIKLTIEYDGTGYHGWQTQANAVTVQDTLEKCIKKLTGEDCNLIGSSRTDVGVHALGQVANFYTNSKIPAEKFSFALNSVLPDDIVIVSSEEAGPDFHARFHAKAKRYLYYIYNSTFPSALLRNRAWHVPYSLDISLMESASTYLKGTHDFTAFRAAGSTTKTSIRTIMDITLVKKQKIIEIDVLGNGFLYNMVRIIAGTLVEVGRGKICPDSIPAILESRDRSNAGITAPAHGLYLAQVFY
ncbi:MAG TPA: tRNA pseudouridine(38-40) synthase TruA [Clostridiaceae bacterium]|nr:tRNA pseudouridine(38-40) synthase TruA [Clostridiaceae bacterium]